VGMPDTVIAGSITHLRTPAHGRKGEGKKKQSKWSTMLSYVSRNIFGMKTGKALMFLIFFGFFFPQPPRKSSEVLESVF